MKRDSRFPIGEFQKPSHISLEDIENSINALSTFPSRLEQLVKNLNHNSLLWTYRKGGWNIAQLVHHCADSHMNSFMRCKLALTENNPIIKPYLEDCWAKQTDYDLSLINSSINIIKGVHQRWTVLLRSCNQKDLKKSYTHPEHQTAFNISETILLYAWHSEHHLKHIEIALQQKGILP